MSRKHLLLIAMLGGLLLAPPEARGQNGFRIIVNKANPVDSMSRDEISALFLKKKTRWEDGERVLPLDQSHNSSVRSRFSKHVHRKSVSAIKNYWQQQIFAGRDVPPPEKATDGQVVAYVESNPGAIGYVTADTNLSSVKVLTIEN